jgi:hypothetical protein
LQPSINHETQDRAGTGGGQKSGTAAGVEHLLLIDLGMALRGAEDAVKQDGTADSEDALSKLEITQSTYIFYFYICTI